MKKILTTIFSAALIGGIFLTGCMKNEESAGVKNVRDGYAEYLKGEAALKLAQAEMEKANAAYRTAEIAVVNAEAKLKENRAQTVFYNNELLRIKVEIAEATKQATIDRDKEALVLELQQKQMALELAKAQHEAEMQNQANVLYEYITTLRGLEATRIEKEIALAKAQADLLGNTPERLAYQEYYDMLFTTNTGYFDQRSTAVNAMITAREELYSYVAGASTLTSSSSYTASVEYEFSLKRDSLEAVNNIARVEALIAQYEGLTGKSVEDLQAEADVQEQAWKKLQDAESAASVTATTAQQAFADLEAKKGNLEKPIYGAGISDGTYTITGKDPMAKTDSELKAESSEFTAAGLEGVVAFAQARKAYIESEVVGEDIPSGYEFLKASEIAVNDAVTPSETYPTKKWLADAIVAKTEEIATLQNAIDKSYGMVLTTRKADFINDSTTWAATNEAYQAAATSVNSAASGFRGSVSGTASSVTPVNNLKQWRARYDITGDASASVTPTFTNSLKNYLLVRVRFDNPDFVKGFSELVTAAGGDSYDDLVAYLSGSTPAEFGTLINDYMSAAATAYGFANDDNMSNIYIVSPYLVGETGGTGEADSHSGTPSAGAINMGGAQAITGVNYTNTSDYSKTQLGKLIQQTYNVFGAPLKVGATLPYKGTVDQSANVDLTVWSSSRAGQYYTANDDYQGAQDDIVELTGDIADYTALQPVCDEVVAAMDAIIAEYEPKLEAALAEVDALMPEWEAAFWASVEAEAALTDATRKAGDAKALYGLLRDDSNVLQGAIAKYVEGLRDLVGRDETVADCYLNDLKIAREALIKYRAALETGAIQEGINALAMAYLQNKIDILTARITNLDALIADLQKKMADLVAGITAPAE